MEKAFIGMFLLAGLIAVVSFVLDGDPGNLRQGLFMLEVAALFAFMYRDKAALPGRPRDLADMLRRGLVALLALGVILGPLVWFWTEGSEASAWASRVGMQLFIVGMGLYIWRKSRPKVAS